MKILCVSDSTSSLAFSQHVKKIFEGVDLILSCGDMPVDSYDYISTMLRRDLYYVYGNHNLNTFEKEMFNDIYHRKDEEYEGKFYGFMLDGKCMRDSRTGLLIAGLGGSMRYNDGYSQYTEAMMRRRIRRLAPYLMYNKLKYGRYLDILITHAPPLGIGDGEDLCHRGFQCFRDFMDRYSPKYLLHGHVHLHDQNAQRVSMYNKTKVINVFGCHLIDDDDLGG